MPESLKQEDSPTKASHLAYYAGEVQLQSSHFYILTEQQCDNRATVSTASHAYLLISTCLSISTIAKGDRVPLRLRCICHCCAGSPWLPEFIRLIDGCLCLSRCGLQDYALLWGFSSQAQPWRTVDAQLLPRLMIPCPAHRIKYLIFSSLHQQVSRVHVPREQPQSCR